MNDNAKRLGMSNSHFGNSNGCRTKGGPMSPRLIWRHWQGRNRTLPALYKKFYGQSSFTWGKTMGSGQAITQANRNPLLGRVGWRGRPKDRSYRRSGIWIHGTAVQNGRRLIMVVAAGPRLLQHRIEESVKLMQWGFNAWQSKPCSRRGPRWAKRRCKWDRVAA